MQSDDNPYRRSYLTHYRKPHQVTGYKVSIVVEWEAGELPRGVPLELAGFGFNGYPTDVTNIHGHILYRWQKEREYAEWVEIEKLLAIQRKCHLRPRQESDGNSSHLNSSRCCFEVLEKRRCLNADLVTWVALELDAGIV